MRKESETSVVLSPTTPNTPGDDNPVFAIPRTEVSGLWNVCVIGSRVHIYMGGCECNLCRHFRRSLIT